MPLLLIWILEHRLLHYTKHKYFLYICNVVLPIKNYRGCYYITLTLYDANITYQSISLTLLPTVIMFNSLTFWVVPSLEATVKASRYVSESIAMSHRADTVLPFGFGRMLTFKAIAQLFILGSSWDLGFFLVEGVLDPVTWAMAYSFPITNTLQRVCVYLVYCLCNHKVNQFALHTFHCPLVSLVLLLFSISWASPLLAWWLCMCVGTGLFLPDLTFVPRTTFSGFVLLPVIWICIEVAETG